MTVISLYPSLQSQVFVYPILILLLMLCMIHMILLGSC